MSIGRIKYMQLNAEPSAPQHCQKRIDAKSIDFVSQKIVDSWL